MGLFQTIKSNWKKSEAAVVIQNLLEHQARHSLFGFAADPAKIANELVARIWDAKPDIFDGNFGQRPHKISVAAIALASAIENLPSTNSHYYAFAIALGQVLQEWETNGSFYPLNSIDNRLLNTALQTFSSLADDSQVADQVVAKTSDTQKKRMDNPKEGIVYLKKFPYVRFEDWFRVYKRSAAKVNDALKPTNGVYLLDLVEDAPLRRAFADKVDPRTLGMHYAKTFDMFKMRVR
jgi:hypothetical protein